jgi:hypothetical protein
MKTQILIRANKEYICDKPPTFKELKNIIIKKTKIPNNSLLIYYKGKIFTEKQFKLLTDNLNILEISVSLKGGFPKFGLITGQLFGFIFLITFIYTIIASLLGTATTYALNHNTHKHGVISAFMNIPGTPNNIYNELFFGTLAFYLFATVVSLTTIANKAHHCNIPVPTSDFVLMIVIPFTVLLLVLFIAKIKANKSNSSIYLIIIILTFIVCGIIQYIRMVNVLDNWKTKKETESSLYNIIFYFLIGYILIRTPFYFNTPFYGFSAIFYYVLSLVFAYIFVIPEHLKLLITQVSGENTICPQH